MVSFNPTDKDEKSDICQRVDSAIREGDDEYLLSFLENNKNILSNVIKSNIGATPIKDFYVRQQHCICFNIYNLARDVCYLYGVRKRLGQFYGKIR